MLVWVDTETTGLIPSEGHLLEVALVATDDNLVERAHFSVVCKPVGIEISDVQMPLIVREMHEKNGLLADVASGGIRRHEAEQLLIDWLRGAFGRLEDLKQVPLAGSTVSFDRRWLNCHMTALEALFSYRSVDVSCLTELANRWAPSVYANRPKADKGKAHRALDDVRESIRYLQYYRGRGFVGIDGGQVIDAGGFPVIGNAK